MIRINVTDVRQTQAESMMLLLFLQPPPTANPLRSSRKRVPQAVSRTGPHSLAVGVLIGERGMTVSAQAVCGGFVRNSTDCQAKEVRLQERDLQKGKAKRYQARLFLVRPRLIRFRLQ